MSAMLISVNIDLMVQDGLYSIALDFIRTAYICNQPARASILMLWGSSRSARSKLALGLDGITPGKNS